MLIKTVSFCVAFTLFFQLTCVKVQGTDFNISAQSAVVMVAATGEVIYSKNAYEQRGMASTTKIMTCVVALENALLTDTVNVKLEDISVEGTSMGLKAGCSVDLYTLLNGMLLESGNDAANVTATLVSGGKESFSVLMNKKAEELGMNNTSFKNPSGLTEEGHYSCAYDMALLGSYAVKNSVFKSICSLKKSTVKVDGSTQTTLYNHNKLLNKYEGAFGIKTGFTKDSGRCLVSAVERDGVTLVVVTLNAYDDWNDHIKLYDYSFPLILSKKADIPLSYCNVPVVNSQKKFISLKLTEDVFIPYLKTVPEYEIRYFVPRFVYADVNKGDYIGWVEVYTKDGVFIDKSYIVSNTNAGNQSEKRDCSL